MRRGRRLGVDVGDVRIGVALSDPDGLIATPVETVARGRGDQLLIVPWWTPDPERWNPEHHRAISAKTFLSYYGPDSNCRAAKWIGTVRMPLLIVVPSVVDTLADPEMSQRLRDGATAAPFGTINALSLAGHRADGSRWVMFSFFGGGLGGNPESDGLNHANNPISMATIPPAEILEAAYPVMFTQWALRPDSAGAGTHRGGVGAVYEIEALTDALAAAPYDALEPHELDELATVLEPISSRLCAVGSDSDAVG